ncbi:MAG: DUF4493 domain-containing protein [Parabacteroides johnsonii]
MKLYIFACLCSLILWGVSCDEESVGIPTGALYLGIEEDATLLTKAESAVTNESLRVDIIAAEGDTIKSYSDYIDEVKGKKIVLPVGTYTISVKSNQSEEAGWEKPFYSGSKEITIQSGEITSVQIVCKISNTKVAVEYAGNLANYFSRYETTVSNTSGSLLYTRDETRAGFFKAEKLTADLRLVNLDGNEFTMQRVFPDIKEQYFYKIKYSLDDGGGNEEAGADFDGIIVDEKTDTIYYGIFIKEEDLFGKSAPKLTLDGFTENKIVYKKADNPVVPEHSLTIEAPNGIKQLKVETTSFQFADIPSFDLCNLTDAARTRLQQLGFPIQEVKDKQKLTFVLTDFAKALELSSATQTTLHTFTFCVLDNLNQETIVVFTYEVRPNVAAYVEKPYCWTTFALLKGYCVDESSYFKVKLPDGTVKDIKKVMRDTEGNVSALVTGLSAGTYSYSLASIDNADMTCESLDFLIAVPSEVPNLGFESWVTLSGSSPTGTKSYTSPNIEANNVYWESGNLGAASASLTLTSATNMVALSSSSTAALLESQWAGFLSWGAFAAGSVFSGYPQKVSTSGANLMYGRPYQGYPTHLRGYYKYIPGKIDYYGDKTPSSGLKEGELDECVINIALSTEQHEVVSTTSQVTPYPYEDATVFAYGTFTSGTTEDLTGEIHNESILNGYVPFKIKLNYKTAIPQSKSFYILIMASSSRYGEYFTGSTSSVMYIDELSLDYEYDVEAFSGTELKGMEPVDINE